MNIRKPLSQIGPRGLSRLYFAAGCFCFFAIFFARSSQGKELLPEPTYDNTFYLFFGDGYRGSPEGTTTYNEDWPHGVLEYRYQLEKLKEILSRVGPDGPYLRIGMADALWPTRRVWASDWSYAGLLGLGDAGDRNDDQFPEARSGPDPYFNNTIMRSWAAVDMPGILFLNSMNMVGQEWAYYDSFTADPGNLTAFLEQHAEAVQRYDDNRISISDDLDDLHEPTDYVEIPEFSGNAPKGTMLTFSRLMSDSLRNGYLKRNIQAAMEHVMAINAHYPGLIVAVSIEAENDMNAVRCHQGECDFWADFSPLALEEWRQWLSHTGIYGPDSTFDGHGAQPWFPTLDDFNAATGSSFSSWSEVDPRDVEHAGPGLWDMYLDGGDMDGEWSPGNPPGSGHEQGWCEVMVEHRCEDSVDWLWEIAQTNGWSSSQIFTHQVPGGFVDEALDPEWIPYWGYEHRLCTLAATAVANGRPGITGFRETTMNPDLFRVLHEELSIDGAWANLEFNPLRATGYFPDYDNDYDVWIDAYKMNWEWGAHMLAAFRWWLPPEVNTSWANIRPEFHPEHDDSIDFEARLLASHDFVSNDDHRFNPWSPEGGSIDENDDFLPPTPSLTKFKYDIQDETISLEIAPEIFAGNSRLLWHDTVRHDLWPSQPNVFGWPEFSEGHFNIHRDTIPDFEPNAFNLTAVIDVPQFSYTDSSLPMSGGVFYAVVAVDNQGDRSPDPARNWVTSRIAFPNGNNLTVELNQSASTDTFVVVANDGERVLTIGSVASSIQWLVVVDAPDVIEPGMVDSILIRISPEDLPVGEHSGSLLISSNDPFDPESTVHVTLEVSLGAIIPLPGPGELTVNPLPTPRLISASWLCGFPGEGVTVELVDLAGRTVHRERILSDEDGMVRHHFRLDSTVGDGAYVLRLSTTETTVQRQIIVLD